MFSIRRIAAVVGFLAAAPAMAQVTSYDAATMVVTIPSVSVGGASYTNVTLKNRGDFVFDLLPGFTEQKPAAPGVATYDVVTNVVTMPAVKVGTQTFLDVKLLNVGNFVFTYLDATALPQSVSDEVAAFALAVEQQAATALPVGGAARLALADSCWASNGRTRANWIADYDANIAAYTQRDAYQIGRRVQSIQVLALRNLVNLDGSSRREIDVQWDVAYRDGSMARGEKSTLISGSSSGIPRCTTPQTGSTLRGLGNQQLVQTAVRAINWRDERYLLASGAPANPAVNYRREIQFRIVDPMGNANYVIVTGPGPIGAANGVDYPFSMKFVSPRLLRSAPEFQGKPGNFLNWPDDDSFRNCRLASGALPVAPIVDCVAQGATNNVLGVTSASPNEATDQTFANQGWIAGGVYRFDVYNDDGWKTINGQAGKTPIATYNATLDRLPYTFAQMAGKYPLINLGGMTTAQLASNAASATPAPLSLSWTLPALQDDRRVHHLFQVSEFHQGAKTGNVGGAFNPAYRLGTPIYPGTTATSTTSFPVTPKLPEQNSKTYTEYNLFFSDPGPFNSIQSRISLQ